MDLERYEVVKTMSNNKIIIGDGKKREEKKKPGLYEIDKPQITDAVTEQETIEQTEQIPLDEDVWGNDHTIINKLSEKQLADRRFYVRVRYFQRIECYTTFDSIEEEPILLTQPIEFIISDLSMGGIGIICDQAISIGKILAIQLTLDTIPYDVKCEVVYCVQNDDKFRAGLKIVKREKHFIKHLKIFIARISLNCNYGKQ